jgi:membrane protease YdiL (CAAX protease family)
MPRRFASAVALFYVPLALVALAWIAWRGGADALVDRLVGERPLFGLGVGTGAGVASAYLLRGLSGRWPAGRALEKGLARLIGPLSVSACVLLALISGICEELAFRAALQPEIGLVAAALIFGAVHAPMKKELLLWPFLAAGMGLVLGWLYDWTGSVIAPAAAHVAVNAINLRYLARKAREVPPPRLPKLEEA